MNPIPILLKQYPFIRLLFALVAGIVAEWYIGFSLLAILVFFVFAFVIFATGFFIPLFKLFKWRWLHGVSVLCMLVALGATLVFFRNVMHAPNWYGLHKNDADKYIVTLKEPPLAKANSFKTEASVDAVYDNGKWQETTGNILLYFKKADMDSSLHYGSVILLKKPVQPIENSGNPGAFDYKRYCLFHGITGQVFISDKDFEITSAQNKNWFQQFLFSARDATLSTIKKYVPGAKEQGVAEALMIGYREDLDKDLVQAYSNTGVVHIIAISGLHLGMIYVLLSSIFNAIDKRRKYTKWLRPVIILAVLWIFTLVAGAVPSILRSAVMFTFIVLGEVMNRKSYMYNTLAASAFCMLVYDPFMLWDVGFLLSYAAVISIISFVKPVSNWLYFKNKILDKTWNLTAVTISAQVLTIPIIVFYFHQFPTMFLLTNFVAVPLSGLILYAEILLLVFAWLMPFAKYIGLAISYSVSAMNNYIENINFLPFSVWSNLQISVLQTWLFYFFILGCCAWFMQKSNNARNFAAAFLVLFVVSICVTFLKAENQEKLIVYNVPRKTAIDFVHGRQYSFYGDTSLVSDGFLRNFHVQPARIQFMCNNSCNVHVLPDSICNIHGKNILVIHNNIPAHERKEKIPIDLLIISGNPKLYMQDINACFECKQIVFDSSNPLWKIELWKKDCEALHLRFHSTAQSGAYVLEL